MNAPLTSRRDEIRGAAALSPSLRCVVVTQPVHQHAYETALAAQESGLLRVFVTGIYDTGRGLTNRALVRGAPARVRAAAERELRRRRHPALDPHLVHTVLRYHALATGLLRLGFPLARTGALDPWAHRRFDHAVARRLRRLEPLRIVHGFEGAALETLAEARRLGATTVLDVPSAHEHYARAAAAEEQRPATLSETLRAERRLADWIFAPSDFVIDCLAGDGVPQERIVRIPYGVDTERFAPVAERNDDVFRVLVVGQVSLMKGIRYLLEAWRRADLPNGELVLVGDLHPLAKPVLREYAGRFRWNGATAKHEVDRFFRQADVLVHASLAEGSALVTYEGMASGLPVIATSSSGSVVRDGQDGFVIPPRDPDTLAEKLVYLHARPDERRRLGTAGRAAIESAYTWRHYRQRVVNAYRTILGESPE